MSYQPDEGIRKMNEWGDAHPLMAFAAKSFIVCAGLWLLGAIPGLSIFHTLALVAAGFCGLAMLWSSGAIVWLVSGLYGLYENWQVEREGKKRWEAEKARLRADHEAREAEVTRADRQTMPVEHAVLFREARATQVASPPLDAVALMYESGNFHRGNSVNSPPRRSALERTVRALGSAWRALKGAGDLVRLIGILAVLIVLYLIAAPVWRAGASFVGAMFPHETRQEAIARADRNEARAQSAENQTHIAVNVAIPQAARTMRVERHVERVENEARERLSSPSVAADPRLLYAEYRRLYLDAWSSDFAPDGDSAPRGTGPMRPANPSPGGNASGLAA